MRIESLAVTVNLPAVFGTPMPDTIIRDMAIDIAREEAEIGFPDEKIGRVEVTRIDGPYSVWDEDGEVCPEREDWLAHVDVEVTA